MAMAAGNPGAAAVVSYLFRDTAKIDPQSALGGFGPLFMLDTLGIYGPNIWILYKDICGESVTRLVAVLRSVQLGIIRANAVSDAILSIKDHTECKLDVENCVIKVKQKLNEFDKA